MVHNKLSLAEHVGAGRIGPTSSFTQYFYCTSEQNFWCLNSESSGNIIESFKVTSMPQLKELNLLKSVVIQTYNLHFYVYKNIESRLLFVI